MEYKNIFKAIAHHDESAVQSFLPEHLEDKDKYGGPPIIKAITHEDKNIFDMLLKSGANPNVSQRKVPLIYYLLIYDWTDKIQIAVEHGLDINQLHALHPGTAKSCEMPFISYICFYLQSYNSSNLNNIQQQYMKFFNKMIRCGARTDIPDQNGKLPIDYLPPNLKYLIADIEIAKLSDKNSYTDFEYVV